MYIQKSGNWQSKKTNSKEKMCASIKPWYYFIAQSKLGKYKGTETVSCLNTDNLA